MPRRRRDFVSGLSYHLTQRGNHKLPVFKDDIDRKVYLKLLKAHCTDQSVRIWAYCLMPNHVHHILVPDSEGGLSVAFQRIHGEYARYFNTRHVMVGHLWQGRFKTCLLDETHLWNAVRYVERNPVRGGLVQRAEDCPWSSAAAHCGLREDSILSPGLPFVNSIVEWAAWLSGEEPTRELEFIRERTRTGRPCSTNEFARQLEALTGLSLLKRKPGRKGGNTGSDTSFP